MKLFVKVSLIVLSFSCWSSFAFKENYTSILKKNTGKARTFSEFQNNVKKDFSEVRRVAGQAIFVSIKEIEKEKPSKNSDPSSI